MKKMKIMLKNSNMQKIMRLLICGWTVFCFSSCYEAK